MEYLFHLIILISIYTLLAQGLSLFSGYTGLLSLAHAGFFGLGAYSSALLSVHLNFGYASTAIISIVLVSTLAWLIAFIALRSYEDYFVVVTISIQAIIYSLMNNLVQLTNGPSGIPNIPQIYSIDSNFSYMLLTIGFASVAWCLLRFFNESDASLVLKAIKDDEVLLKSLGKPVELMKRQVFVTGAAIAALAGTLYAHHISYIDPSSFTLDESIFILAIVVVGGVGSLRGAFFASIVMVLLPELLRLLGVAEVYGANINQSFYGLLLVVIILYQGIGAKEKAREE